MHKILLKLALMPVFLILNAQKVNAVPATKKDLTVNNSDTVISSLQPVYDNYFLLKDALFNSNPVNASAAAQKLYDAVNAVKMEALGADVQAQWMKVSDDLKTHSHHIEEAKTNLPHQREHFAQLSLLVYSLIKLSKPVQTVYVDHCPMYNNGKGADWLSKESAIKNPYYGAAMPGCGTTKETIH